MQTRRVVTGMVDGRSVVVSDGPAPNFHAYRGWPGHTTSVVWATATDPSLPAATAEPAPAGMDVLPGPGETRLMIVRLPPDAVFADPRFDPALFDEETLAHSRDLSARFEPDAPGFHTTDSVDYDIVLDGEVWLELDEGEATHLRAGDIAIQNGTRHAWRNRSDRTTTMAFVLIGARRG